MYDFDEIRHKWRTVPAGQNRYDTADILALPDDGLLSFWQARCGEALADYAVRGWYHDLYTNAFRGLSVLDLGCGLGIDGIAYARSGAQMTFADIVPENVELVRRVCALHGIDGEFITIDTLADINRLPLFDAIYAQGSLINSPYETAREEVQQLVEHLPIGGRWVELAYPKERWQRDGCLPFAEWGSKTDGADTPWVEWCDANRRLESLKPARFRTILAFNFHGDDFHWIDLQRVE